MLSRTADHLYWMSRYTERAENTARMLSVAYETAMLPQAIQNEAYALNNIGITQNGFVVGFVNVAFERQKRGNEFVQLKARLQNSAINVS